jgi:acetyl-CoA carboxylase biotin carboxylase subunit
VFSKVLVANRGEIARRVMRTCRRLGIATVAVYSDVDADAPHVREADEAVRVGPAEATASYLDIGAIVDACRRSGADAIHPGYGFLSENADFATACREAGITFIGPSPDVIRLMGDKAAAKAQLAEAGVPVVPGAFVDDLSDDAIAKACADIGYPLLVKAVAGGGGKGMRAVHDPADLQAALDGARREARNAFGDDRILIERLVEHPRHVEAQVFGDTHGSVVHLFERECSVQRRHQKVVEETPSPAVDDALRARIGQAAVTAAQAVGYVGAGTVEFLLAPGGEFYFLEMNTRLQVEHPVTELITGQDLVEWQLRVAAGEPLPLSQDELTTTGHAIEARLYAEDPAGGFLPQTGPVLVFAPPRADDLRVDSGVESGSEVSRFYDPMLAKIIVHGPDRHVALERLLWALRHTAVLGVTTNIEHLAAIVDHDVFRDGGATTTFLDEHLTDWTPAPTPHDLLVAGAVVVQRAQEQRVRAGDPHSPWQQLGPWRTGQIGGWRATFAVDDGEHVLAVTGRHGRYRVSHGDHTHDASVSAVAAGVYEVAIDGHETVMRFAEDGDVLWVHATGFSRPLRLVPPTRAADHAALAGAAAFQSPMPGAVIAVLVGAGDEVTAGTTLLVVEAMKMEHPVKAPTDGTVTAVLVIEGDAVDGGQALLTFEPKSPDAAA